MSTLVTLLGRRIFSGSVLSICNLGVSDIFIFITNARKEDQRSKCLFLTGHWGSLYKTPYSSNIIFGLFEFE